MLLVRSFKNDDLDEVLQLRQETIAFINANDYSPEQITAWIGEEDLQRRLNIFNSSYTLVAEEADKIVGYANLFIDQCYLDQLYVHKDFQDKGVASALFQAILDKAKAEKMPKITVEASITSKTFFEKQGFVLLTEQQKAVSPSITLTNFIMQKLLPLSQEKP